MLGWRWGELSRVQALLLLPLLPNLLPKGGACSRGVGWGWMQFQPQSPASWLEAIFSLGPQACLPACPPARWFSALTPLL